MKIKLIILLLSFSCTSFAVQNININELAPVKIAVSQNEMNLIVLKNDRIDSLALPGTVDLEQNPKDGTAYLRFKSAKVIKGFLTTELGAKYQLEFIPSAIASETIVLIQPGLEKKTQNLEAREYTQMLAQLLRAMHNETELDGYAKEIADKNVSHNNFKLKLITTYSGGSMSGLVYEYENTGNNLQNLKEIDFYNPQIRAIAIRHKTLYSGDVTKIYMIRNSA